MSDTLCCATLEWHMLTQVVHVTCALPPKHEGPHRVQILESTVRLKSQPCPQCKQLVPQVIRNSPDACVVF